MEFCASAACYLSKLAGEHKIVIIFAMPKMGADERKARDEAFDELMASINPDFALRREMKLARKRAGLSQRALAKRMRTGQTVIARLEQGRSSPTVKTLRRMAEVTGSRLVIHLEPTSSHKL